MGIHSRPDLMRGAEVKLSALHRPGAIVTIVAVWLVSRTPLAPDRRTIPREDT